MDTKSENKKRRWSDLAFATIFIVAGVCLFASGRLGYKYAYGEGPHVRLGGALLLVLGVLGFVQALRVKKEEPNQKE